MKIGLLILLGFVFLCSVLRSYFLGGETIYRLNVLYPRNYKDYTWAFGTRLKELFFIRKVRKDELKDSTLCRLSKKIQLSLIIRLISFICIIIVAAIF